MDIRQVAMTEDQGIGVVGLQTVQDCQQRGFLCGGTGVVRLSLFVETTLVADTDAVLVILPGMGTNGLLAPTGMDPAITGNVVVVAYAVVAFGTVACL